MLTFNLKTTFSLLKRRTKFIVCRIYFVSCIQNVNIIKDITRQLKDMDFMFSWQEQYLTRSLAALPREILFLPREHKIHIFSQPCNFLYICAIYKPSERALSVCIDASRRHRYAPIKPDHEVYK